MAILKMKKITIVGLNRERKRVLELLHKKEAVEVSELDTKALGLEKKETAKSISQFDSHCASSRQALEILSGIEPEKTGMFYKRPELGDDQYSMSSTEYDVVLKDILDIIRLSKKIKENTDEIGQIEAKLSGLVPYMKLDVPMNLRGTAKTKVRIGTLEGLWDAAQIMERVQEVELLDVYVEVLYQSKNFTSCWFLYPKQHEGAFEQFIHTMPFSEPPFSLSHRTPEKKAEALRNKQQELETENLKIQAELSDYIERREAIQLFHDHLILRKEKYEVLDKMGITAHAFVLDGYVPERDADELKQELETKFTCSVQLDEAGEDAPVAFSNNAFTQPVENITGDYSMPSVHDIDPNPIMAVFYYFFFGMMFSDAGYGLLLMIACGLLGFGKFLEKGKRRMFRMFFFCGVSTTFWGILYGSFFGDMIKTVSTVFGSGNAALNPVLFDPVSKPLELLIISVAFGMIHILMGLGIRFYMLWREKKYLDALFDQGFWMLLLVGASVLAAGLGLGQAVVGEVGKYMAIAGAVGLVLTQGRDKKNIIMKFFGGVLSLYDITSYVGDLLSYSRLMALGLATGVIASVVNVLASLGGNSIVGWIMFIVISIVGHLLNFAINMLGAYVHTNRLQYVEFYQKFYEGGGRRFKPFSMNTKYFNFSKN